jgi:hypothetical protein
MSSQALQEPSAQRTRRRGFWYSFGRRRVLCAEACATGQANTLGFHNLWRRLQPVMRVLKGILNEITDQNAYRRHLTAHHAEHSGEEWRKFCDERWKAKAQRTRCC